MAGLDAQGQPGSQSRAQWDQGSTFTVKLDLEEAN